MADKSNGNKENLTLRAVSRQLNGMGVEDFEIGIRDELTGKVMLKTWTKDEILSKVGFLQSMSMRGNHIYVRPNRSTENNIILVDDLSKEQLNRMKAEKLQPAVIVETSPNNFQAWVNVGNNVSKEIKTGAAKFLAQRYHGDPASAEGEHFGRLSGFSNPKEKYKDAQGRSPFVICRDWNGKTAEKGESLISYITSELEKKKTVIEKKTEKRKLDSDERKEAVAVSKAKDRVSYKEKNEDRRDAYEEFRKQFSKAEQKNSDLSQCDWYATTVLLMKGFSETDVELALLSESPNLGVRKKGHERDYVERTVRKASMQSHVIDAQSKREKFKKFNTRRKNERHF